MMMMMMMMRRRDIAARRVSSYKFSWVYIGLRLSRVFPATCIIYTYIIYYCLLRLKMLDVINCSGE